MNKAKNLLNLVEIGRPKDSAGKSLYGQGEYVLQSKRFKTFVGMDGVHAALVPSINAAKIYTGDALMNMAYDWQMDFAAIDADFHKWMGKRYGIKSS